MKTSDTVDVTLILISFDQSFDIILIAYHVDIKSYFETSIYL